MKKISLTLLILITMLVSIGMVNAQHDTSVTLSPEWSAPNSAVTYTATIENLGPDSIREVYIYRHPAYGPLSCPSTPYTGWTGVLLPNTYDSINNVATDACYFYTSSNTYNIPSGDNKIFTFDTTTPADESCELTWLFRTIDQVQAQAFGQWIENNATTGVDNQTPEFVKTVTGDQALNGDINVACPNGPNSSNGEYCHITDQTLIDVVVTDPGDAQCGDGLVIPSGMDYCDVQVKVDGVVDDSYDQTIYGDDDNDPNSITFQVQFKEDTEHELIFTCYDNAGNMVSDAEMFRVDMKAPTTTIDLEAGNEYYTDGTSQWLDTDSAISLSVVDNPTEEGGICAIGTEETYYQMHYFPDDVTYTFGNTQISAWDICDDMCDSFQTTSQDDDGWLPYDGGIIEPGEESCHVIEAYSVDQFGHVEDVVRECYFVDKTVPTMDKIVGEPKAPMCDYREHSVSGSTDMALAGWGGSLFNFTEDNGGNFGWDSFDIMVTTNTDGTVDFDLSMPRDLYTEPDNFDLVVDADNDGTPDFLVHYYVEMDAKAPIDSHWSYKAYDGSWSANVALPAWISATPDTNGESDFTITMGAEKLGGCGATFGYGVQAPLADEGSDFIQGNGEAAVVMFPENVGDLFGGTDNYELVTLGNNMDWYVTTGTDIELTCVDEGDHPSGNEMIYWNSYKWSDSLQDWELMDASSGSVQDTSYTFNFDEVSRHKLEWYCEDAVGKTTATDVEYFNVDDEAPIITKDVEGTQAGVCPPPANIGEPSGLDDPNACFVTDESVVIVNVEDTFADHMSNGVQCTYTVFWHTDEVTCVDAGYSWQTSSGKCIVEAKPFTETNYFEVSFAEDSLHELYVACQDRVGVAAREAGIMGVNTEVDVEYFYVDMKPPVTTKTYDEPEVVLENGKTYRWITSATDITLSAVDEKIGVEKIYYTHEWVSDDMCEAYLPESTYYPHGGYFKKGIYQWDGEVVLGDYPSTNNLNSDKLAPLRLGENAPHVNVLNVGLGFVELEFVNLAPGLAYFEYRIDGVEVGSTNHPVVPGDVIHPGVSVTSGNTIVQTFNAGSHVEIRLVLGGERDWDFDWTRFDVLPDTTGWEYESGDSVMFNIPDESCHIIQYYAVDVFGNVEDIQTQYVMVDNSAPEMDKVIGTPHVVGEDGYDYITQQTPISLSCQDVEPHPVGGVTLDYRYRTADDCANLSSSAWTDWRIVSDTVKASSSSMVFSSGGWAGWSCPAGTTVIDGGYEPSPADYPVAHSLAWEPGACVGEVCWPETPHGYTYGEDETGWIVQNGEQGQSLSVYAICADPLYFPEDSCHELEYRCEDALGNMAASEFEIDVVDTQAPEITFGIEGPTHTIGDNVFINGVTNITVDANDVLPHPVGDVLCYFDYAVEGNEKVSLANEGQELVPPFKVNFPEESKHTLHVECWDALGNKESVDKIYFVDKTKPSIWKTYEWLFSDVYEEDEEMYWAKFTRVNSSIYAGVNDQGPHLSGIADVKYKVSLAENDDMCKYPLGEIGDDVSARFVPKLNYDVDCSEASEGGWNTVAAENFSNFEFNVSEESCHVIEIMATDNVEKCALHKQYVYVDATAPVTDKKIGEPKTLMSVPNREEGSKYYPELLQEGFCETMDANDNPKCSDITLLTPIDLDCEDLGPHPSGATDICFNVEFITSDVTADYCQDGQINDDGYCCMQGPTGQFLFGEESHHKLSYYCIDEVGNVGEADIEYFKVEGTAFEIQLNYKWNLISTPVQLLDNSMGAVFDNHSDTVVSVWTQDADKNWYSYTPDGVDNDNLDKMEPGWGYWVFTNLTPDETDLLTIGGYLFSPGGPTTYPAKDVGAGYNLIGYWNGAELAPIGPNGKPGYYGPAGNGNQVVTELCSLKPTDDDRGISGIWSYWAGDGFEPLGQFSRMDPGAGYLVNVYSESADNDYTPGTMCNGFYQILA